MKYKLRGHESMQCHVTIGNSSRGTKVIDFTSYSTLVIRAEGTVDLGWDIECFGTYSQTTAKQIGCFLKEYFPNLTYQDMKAIAGRGMCRRSMECARADLL